VATIADFDPATVEGGFPVQLQGFGGLAQLQNEDFLDTVKRPRVWGIALFAAGLGALWGARRKRRA
jgi:hypothetical protein